jgi:hypothetical protein
LRLFRVFQAGTTFALFAAFAGFVLDGDGGPGVGHNARAFYSMRSALISWLGSDGAALASVAIGLLLAILVYFGPAQQR